MGHEKKWTLIVSFGIGISSLFFASRSLSRAIGRWRFMRKFTEIERALKVKLSNPIENNTVVVTKHSDWDIVSTTLLRYVN